MGFLSGNVAGRIRHDGTGVTRLVVQHKDDEFVVDVREETEKGHPWVVRLKDRIELDGGKLTVQGFECGTRRLLKLVGRVDVPEPDYRRAA